ncbi:MAG: hypothetical protein IKB88_11810 [Clostridia bacterium]|nr:hypothetical protein [Clostridia bacterium]
MKTTKKLISIMLCAVLLFSTASVAFAAESDTKEALEKDFVCHDYYSVETVVVTYNEKYTEIGEVPSVTIYSRERDSEEVNVTEVSSDRIHMEIYEHNGKRYPQLFIDVDFCWKVLAVEVGAGAFVTEDGEKSAEVEVPYSRIIQCNFEMECECTTYYFCENYFNLSKRKTHYYAIVGMPVKVVTSFKGNHADAWLEKAKVTYTVNGRTVEINSYEFVPEEPGEYIVQINIGNKLKDTVKFNVGSEKSAYFDGLELTGKHLLAGPLEVVFGIFAFFFVPGFGTLGGPVFVVDGVLSIPNFFKSLFNGPEYHDHTFG